MSEKTEKFIKTVGVLARNEFLSREQWILPSVCIAQGALESGWNLNARSLFGIKGNGFTSTTSEFYDGHRVEIEDSFKEYPDLSSSVVGYFDFLRDTQDENGNYRYANALNNTDYKDTVDKLINTSDGAPYATDPDYIEIITTIIEQFNLTEYDFREEKTQDEEPQPQDENEPTIEPQELGLVQESQVYVNSFGFGIDEDNIYGPQTRDGLIKAYQQAMNDVFGTGLEVDGIFGQCSRSAGNNYIQKESNNEVVKVLQACLQAIYGYDMEGLNTGFGDITDGAVLDFQSNNGLVTDGIVGPDTWSAIFA